MTSLYVLFCLSLSFCIFLSVKPRSYGHFPSPTPSVSPRGIFNKTHLLLNIIIADGQEKKGKRRRSMDDPPCARLELMEQARNKARAPRCLLPRARMSEPVC